jgi:hypothetical protein
MECGVQHILTVYTSNMARPDYPSRAAVFIEVRFANIVYVVEVVTSQIRFQKIGWRITCPI